MPATTTPAAFPDPTSPIQVMHAQYERAWEAYNQLDNARLVLTEEPDDRRLDSLYEDAMGAANEATDALRVAILHQVPMDWTDAMLLQFHINCMCDLERSSVDAVMEHDKSALAIALDTIFDFMACENQSVDHEGIGKQFHGATLCVFNRRRRRTGILED